jgi:hypothetical protein
MKVRSQKRPISASAGLDAASISELVQVYHAVTSVQELDLSDPESRNQQYS